MQEPGKNSKRKNVEYFEGVNSLASHHVAKMEELSHAENARSVKVGSIEKREGQTVLGTNVGGTAFKTDANYGLFYFNNDSTNKGLYRLSAAEKGNLYKAAETTYSASTITIDLAEGLLITENINGANNSNKVYYLDENDKWTPLTGDGANLDDYDINYTIANGNLFFVNGVNTNRYITSDGTTVVTSDSPTGHLYGTPLARKINYYKGLLYLGDLTVSGTRHNKTIIESTELRGYMDSGLQEDVGSAGSATFKVTETDYFSTATGANEYDIYRADTKITTITVTAITNTQLTATLSPAAALNSGDRIYIKDTFNGENMRYLWPYNVFSTKKTLRQSSITSLSPSSGGEITMMTNIGNVMMVSNDSDLVSWNGSSAEHFDLGIGNVSHTGYVKLLGGLFFMHYSGVYATSGGVPRLISNKVERYINGATKAGKEACVAGKKGKSIFFTIGDVTLYNPDGSTEKTMSDVCLEYNLVQENWFVHTNVKASQMATYLETVSSDRLILTSTSGDMATKEFLSGETDDGEEIFFRIDLNRMTLNPEFEKDSVPIAIIADTERGSSMKAFVSGEEGSPSFYELDGTIGKGISIIKINGRDKDRGSPVNCRLLDVSFRDASKQLCKIKRVSVVFMPTDQESVIQ